MKAKTTGTLAVVALGAAMAAVLCLSRGAAVEAAYPAERAWRAVALGAWRRVTGAFRGASAAAEAERLKVRVEELSLLEWEVRRLGAENERLRSALGYAASAPGGWIAAEVLSRGGGSSGSRHLFRAGKGSLAGVEKGAVAVVPAGLVGRVESVTPHTCEIRLVTDPSLKVSCEAALPDGSRLRGILSGGTDECLALRHLLSPADVPDGSSFPVSTSGLGGVYPSGIAVGSLRRVRRDPDSPRREGEVRPAVDFATLEDVFIRRER